MTENKKEKKWVFFDLGFNDEKDSDKKKSGVLIDLGLNDKKDKKEKIKV